MKTVNVGLLGLGTVGGGTATVLLRNADEIKSKLGCELSVVHAAGLDIAKQTILDSNTVSLTEDAFIYSNFEGILNEILEFFGVEIFIDYISLI